MDLTDEQWNVVGPLIKEPPRRADGRGRPRVPPRPIIDAILWMLRTGAPWADLPARYPPYQTCHRRFQPCARRDVRARQKRGRQVGKTRRGKGTKIMAIADGTGLPVALCTESASPHEVTLVERTLDARFIGDKAYDSDRLDAHLRRQRGIELIAPNIRYAARRALRQDGRSLRRYRRLWKIERLFAWLQNFRRLVVRYEYHVEHFLDFLRLGCVIILLRCFLR